MSLPIDYWDYLGWKDTLALPGHTIASRAYARARGDREVYTPQVVVNAACMCSAATKTRSRTRSCEPTSSPERCRLPVYAVGCQWTDLGERAGHQGAAAKGEVWLCPITRMCR